MRWQGLLCASFGIALLACSSSSPSGSGTETDASTGDTGSTACVPGMSTACSCTDGSMGAQVCLADGSGYDACECDGTTVSSTLEGTSTDSQGEETIDPTDDATVDPTTESTDSVGTDSSGGEESSTGAPVRIDLDGWTRRRAVTITNELSYELVDFQVLVHVEQDDDTEADFSDLRFTTESVDELLPHWRERYTAPVEAFVWVRMPSIPADGSVDIWMYYGNPDADDASDGEATMFFVDDFEGGALDGTKWGENGEQTFDSGMLELTTGSVYTNDAVIAEGQMVQTRVYWPCCGEQVSDSPAITSAYAQSGVMQDNYLGFYDAVLHVQYAIDNMSYPNMTAGLNGPGQGTWQDIGLARSAGEVHFARLYAGVIPSTVLSFGADLDGDHYIILGGRSGVMANGADILDMQVDSVFVRTFAAVEPTTLVGAEEDAP